MAGCVDFDDAVKRYRCGVINDDCVRVAHFLHDLIDNGDHYASCLLTKFMTMEYIVVFSLHSDVFLISFLTFFFIFLELCVPLLYVLHVR